MASMVCKFRGCMAGSLIGDCMGAPFEGDIKVALSVLNNYIDNKLKAPKKGTAGQMLPYTDDTAMTRSVAQSLIENKSFNAIDMAKRFTHEFLKDQSRGYGQNIGEVFFTLKKTDFEDVFLPARNQFDGHGSYGNGAAMRIAPVALFCSKNDTDDDLLNIAKQSSLLTHTNPDGYNGAILQCLAVNYALKKEQIDQNQFLDHLIMKMDKMQEEFKDVPKARVKLDKQNLTYSERLKKVKLALERPDLQPEEAAVLLGNDVSAPESVPSAIYSFLRGLKPLEIYKNDNPFLRTLFLAISLGGDTDTIASMACAIAGAYHGIDQIPKVLQDRCEGIEYALKQADSLANVC